MARYRKATSSLAAALALVAMPACFRTVGIEAPSPPEEGVPGSEQHVVEVNSQPTGAAALVHPGIAEVVRRLPVSSIEEKELIVHGVLHDVDTNEPIRSGRIAVTESKSFCSPIEDAEGNITGIGCGTATLPFLEEQAGSDGRFVLRFDPEKDLNAVAHADGYAPADVPIEAGHDSPEAALEIVLQRAARIEGTVTAGTHENVVVKLGPDDSFGEGFTGSVLEVDVCDGRYSLAPVPPRQPLKVEVWSGEDVIHAASVVVGPGEVRRLDWNLAACGPLRGRALDESGQPVAGFRLSLDARLEHDGWFGGTFVRTVTDAQGSFVFADVPMGTWYVGPAYAELNPDEGEARFAPFAHEIKLGDADERVSFDLVLPLARYIRGAVVGPDGEPIPDAPVVARGGRQECWQLAESDANGNFAIGPLNEGRYKVLSQRGLGFGLAGSALAWPTAGDQDVRLQLAHPGRLGSTAMRADTGVPVDALTWFVYQDERGLECEGVGWHMRPGRYAIVGRTSGGLVGVTPDVEVEAGGSGSVKVELAEGARLRLHNASDEIIEAVLRWRGAALSEERLRPGVEVETIVPPGDLVVEWCRRDPEGAPFWGHAGNDRSRLNREVLRLPPDSNRLFVFD